MGKIVDSFKNNIRFNIIIPGQNNDGSIFDKLAMNNHEYMHFVKHHNNLKKIFSLYTPRYDEEYLRKTFPVFREKLSNYNEVYFAKSDASKQSAYLKSVKCPYSVVGLPRTGFTVMINTLLEGHSVFLVNFSLPHTEHKEYGFIEDRSMNVHYSKSDVDRGISAGNGQQGCHYTLNEVKIIKWLHDREIIDASLCLISDTPKLSYNLGDMKFSSYMNQRVSSCIMSL